MARNDALASRAKEWKKSQPAKSAAPLPDGTYQVDTTQAILEKVKSGKTKGNTRIAFHYTVLTGPDKGSRCRRYIDLDSPARTMKGPNGAFKIPSGFDRLQGDLDIMGLLDELNKIGLTSANLKKILKKTLGTKLEVGVRTGTSGFTNVNPYRMLDMDSEIEDDDLLEDDEEEDEVEENEEDEDDQDDEDEDEEDEEEDDEEDEDDDDFDDFDDEDDEEEEEEDEPEPEPVKKGKKGKKAAKKTVAKKTAKKAAKKKTGSKSEKTSKKAGKKTTKKDSKKSSKKKKDDDWDNDDWDE